MSVRRLSGSDACRAHVALMTSSMTRRQSRGESVTTEIDTTEMEALLVTRAAEIFQAVQESTVMSSMLVLRAASGGYDHSSGTVRQGMSMGASHFLIFNVARILKSEGNLLFNLGGARKEEQGLRAFKSHFGTQEIESEALEIRLGTGLEAGKERGDRAGRVA